MMIRLLPLSLGLLALFGLDLPAAQDSSQRLGRPAPGSSGGARMDQEAEPQRGLRIDRPGAFQGYTLFAPLRSNKTYLIDMQGEVAHSWESELPPGNSAYLLDNGHLLRCARQPDNRVFRGGGQGGRIQQFDWDGKLVWDYAYSSDEHLHHHDIEPLPNGHVLLIAWERKTKQEAIEVGRDPRFLRSEEFWPDFIVEIEPQPPTGGKVVWEWHAWDHLVQDLDGEKQNFAAVGEHPERIDINGDRAEDQLTEEQLDALAELGYVAEAPPDRRRDRRGGGADWNHTNSIDYNPELDQIMISVRSFSELWIIDHGTTTEEASGSTGGRRGRGGDLLYRWGNPQSYRAGTSRARRLYVQHDAQWIEPDCPGAGNVLIFNNGSGRPGGDHSTVDEIVLPLESSGSYTREAEQAFAPRGVHWRYRAPEKSSFYSGHISGAQRLPNGNTLICSGEQGRLFEVDPDGEIMWEYWNPFGGEVDGRGGGPDREPPGGPGGRSPGPEAGRGPGRGGPPPGGPGGRGMGPRSPHAVFRATRLAPDHPGLKRLK